MNTSIDLTVSDGIEDFNRIPDIGYHQSNPFSKQGESKDELETTSEFWHSAAKHQLGIQLDKKPNTNKAKNIIFFLGDGMSHPSVGKKVEIYLGPLNYLKLPKSKIFLKEKLIFC